MSEIENFLNIMETLASENGCPWDRVQTHSSLKPSCVEETAELICGINLFEKTGNADNLKEELGDMLMLIVLQCEIAQKEGLFSFDDVVKSISEKMIRRHPNVFSDNKNMSLEQQKILWEEIKEEERKNKNEMIDQMLPQSFEEVKELVEMAKQRKGFA